MPKTSESGRSRLLLANILFIGLSGLAVSQAQANLVVNGSFENRDGVQVEKNTVVDGAPVGQTYSFGMPDNWTDILDGDTYLVHEDHHTVPGNQAKDGEIIVGGQNEIWLSQIITTTLTSRLQATWWGNNETSTGTENTDPEESPLYSTGVDFWDLAGNRIETSGFRFNYDPDQVSWFEQSFTTTNVFAPGDYQVRFYVGGRSSADDLVITEVPSPATLALMGLGLAGLRYSSRKKA